MLHTAHVSVLAKVKRKVKSYYVIRNHGNDVVVPDQDDLDSYRNGVLTWKGFKLNYSAKLMREDADEWMRCVSVESINEEVVLVSDEKSGKRCYRILLAERINNLFSGRINFKYLGELTV